MNIDHLASDALERISRDIEKSYQKASYQVRLSFCAQIIPLEIRDRDHFYKVVKWCNKNIGQGRKYWTVEGRVLRYVDPSKRAYNPPAKKRWLIKVPGIDCSPLLKM